MTYQNSPRPRLMAHRGLSLSGAENTLAAFRAAIVAGATCLETDAQASSDGVAFAFHDDDVDRLTSAHGSFAALDAAHIETLTVAGERIPPLLECLTAFPDVTFNIDIKNEHALEPVVAAVAAAGATARVLVSSFEPALAARAVEKLALATGITPLRSASPDELLPLITLHEAVTHDAPSEQITQLTHALGVALHGVFAVQVPLTWGDFPVVTPLFMELMSQFGIEVHVWTIDEPDDMQWLLDIGVSGIVTNRVDLLHGVVNQRGSQTSTPAP